MVMMGTLTITDTVMTMGMDTVINRITMGMAMDTVTMDMGMNMIMDTATGMVTAMAMATATAMATVTITKVTTTATALGTSVESQVLLGRRFSPTPTSQPSKTLNCPFQPDLDLVLQVDMDQQRPPATSLLQPVTSTYLQSNRTRLQAHSTSRMATSITVSSLVKQAIQMTTCQASLETKVPLENCPIQCTQTRLTKSTPLSSKILTRQRKHQAWTSSHPLQKLPTINMIQQQRQAIINTLQLKN